MIILITLVAMWMPQDSSTSDSALSKKIEHQVRHYVEQIRLNQRTDQYLWALANLCQLKSHPEVIKLINTQASTIDFFPQRRQPLCSDEPYSIQLAQLAKTVSSPALLLGAILQEDNTVARQYIYEEYYDELNIPSRVSTIPFDKLFQDIINKRTIGPSSLPIDRFTFTHFLVLTNKYLRQENIITTDFISNVVDSWLQSEISYNTPSLMQSLYTFSLFKGLYYSGKFSKTIDLYPELISDKLFPISQERLAVFRFLDFTMYRLGYYDRSLEVSRKFSVPLSKYLNDRDKEMSSLISQAAYLLKIGKIKEAQKINLGILERSNANNSSVTKSTLYTNLSITYLKSGDFDRYFDLQHKALELAESQKHYENQLKILRNLHIVYRSHDDQPSALRYIKEALELAKEHGKTKDLASIYTSMGVFYRDLKFNPDSASSYFTKADSLINQHEDYKLYIDLLVEKAKLLEYRNQYQQALEIYQNTQEYVLSQEDTHSYLDALIDEGRMQLELGQISKVERIVEELRNVDLSILDFADIVKAKTLEAHYLIKDHQREDAYQILKPTISQVVEWAQNSTDLQSGYWNVEPEYLNAFQLYVDLMIDTNRSQEAVLALDQLKTINDAELYQDPMVKSSQLNESELTQYQRLTNQLDQLRKQQLSTSGQQWMDLQSRIDRLNAQKRILDRKISRHADEPTLTDVQQIQQRLTPKDLVMHITELKDTYYLAQITKRDINFQTVKLDSINRRLFEDAIQELSTGDTDLSKLHQISQLLNLSQLPDLAENIIMIPDSYLFQLPLDILPLSKPDKNYSYGGTSYLIEQYRTEYLTSLSELAFDNEPQKSFSWDYVGFGISDFSKSNKQLMPLPYASREVTQISQELHNLEHHQTILGEQSTEVRFRKTAPNARILHLATHSKVSDKDPLFSTIYMSPPPAEESTGDQYENQIFAYELFEMNLANDLIMLNSCESGSGSYLQGSGIVGISRALRFAGAQSLVLNLWSVNDMMASDFAIQFYKALNTGDTKAEALRKAKVHFLKQKNANPHYWGPYIMIGSNRPVVEPNRSSNTVFASGFMAYFLLMVGLSFMVQRRKRS